MSRVVHRLLPYRQVPDELHAISVVSDRSRYPPDMPKAAKARARRRAVAAVAAKIENRDMRRFGDHILGEMLTRPVGWMDNDQPTLPGAVVGLLRRRGWAVDRVSTGPGEPERPLRAWWRDSGDDDLNIGAHMIEAIAPDEDLEAAPGSVRLVFIRQGLRDEDCLPGDIGDDGEFGVIEFSSCADLEAALPAIEAWRHPFLTYARTTDGVDWDSWLTHYEAATTESD